MNRRDFLRLTTLGAIGLAPMGCQIVPIQPGPANAFRHPGLLHDVDDLARVRAKLEQGQTPWANHWRTLRDATQASLAISPSPRAEVERGPYNEPDLGATDLARDSNAAYNHALMWCLTGERTHAQKAVELLNAWSATLESVGGHDTQLLIGMLGVKLCNAAELIRHTYIDWRTDDQQRFEQWLREVLYPPIEPFYPSANGNWDASMIQTMLAMGVFLDDRTLFDRAANYYRQGKGNGAVENYINDFGQCQETGRDQSHTQMGLGFLSCACEIAWKQGIDLYAQADHRLALGFEYTAQYNLGHPVRYEPYLSFEGRYHYQSISNRGRGRFAPIYQRVVNHYHGRLGMPMPHCHQAAKRQSQHSRPQSTAHMLWDTLMFA